MTTTKTKKAIAAKPLTKPVDDVRDLTSLATDDALAAEYMKLKHNEGAIAERLKELQSEIRGRMVDGTLETEHGAFKLETRRSYSWDLAAVKIHFGPRWTEYAKADDRLIRTKMESGDKVLEKLATVKVVEALTMKPIKQ